MRLAAFVSRVRTHDYADWIGADHAFAMATAGSAQALGMPDVGRVEPGALADLAFLDLGHINWIPMNDPVNQLVQTEDGSAVTGVIVAPARV